MCKVAVMVMVVAVQGESCFGSQNQDPRRPGREDQNHSPQSESGEMRYNAAGTGALGRSVRRRSGNVGNR